MELPPYRMPTTKAIFRQTWFKGAQYLRKMGTIILTASVIIWALGYFPRGQHIDKRIDQKITELQQSVDAGTSGLAEEQLSNAIHELELQRQQQKQEYSMIGRIGHFIEPVIAPLGFDWKMGVSLLAGSAAKEIVISTMGVLYQANPDTENGASLVSKLQDSRFEDGPKKARR